MLPLSQDASHTCGGCPSPLIMLYCFFGRWYLRVPKRDDGAPHAPPQKLISRKSGQPDIEGILVGLYCKKECALLGSFILSAVSVPLRSPRVTGRSICLAGQKVLPLSQHANSSTYHTDGTNSTEFLNSFRTAVSLWRQTSQFLSILSPKRDYGPNRGFGKIRCHVS